MQQNTIDYQQQLQYWQDKSETYQKQLQTVHEIHKRTCLKVQVVSVCLSLGICLVVSSILI